jgi:hypothetical protein
LIWKSGNNPWLIKGVIDTQVNVNYDSTGIKEYTDILMTLNWDTEAESVKRVSDHVYFKVLNELASTEEHLAEDLGVKELLFLTVNLIQQKLNLFKNQLLHSTCNALLLIHTYKHLRKVHIASKRML